VAFSAFSIGEVAIFSSVLASLISVVASPCSALATFSSA